jgi:hypothetical protein
MKGGGRAQNERKGLQNDDDGGSSGSLGGTLRSFRNDALRAARSARDATTDDAHRRPHKMYSTVAAVVLKSDMWLESCEL